MTSSRRTRRSRGAILILALFLAASQLTLVSAEPVVIGFDAPATAASGDVITIHVNATSAVPIREVEGAILFYRNPGTGQEAWVPMNLTGGNLTSGEWSFTIPAQPWEGSLECRVTLTDQAGAVTQYPPTGTYAVRITGEDEPRPFPWNLVIVIAFLGVALVLTELVFKPGLYRKTGRQRARELEEEDRARESENEPEREP